MFEIATSWHLQIIKNWKAIQTKKKSVNSVDIRAETKNEQSLMFLQIIVETFNQITFWILLENTPFLYIKSGLQNGPARVKLTKY
mgnify:CR=1 FL=1